MKRIGYRIMEFGKFNWEDVMTALRVFKTVYGHVEVPADFVVCESVLEQRMGFEVEDGRLEGLLLGEAVEAIRTGDIDGLEDPERRALLDELGFSWGDLSKYQRYRFAPMIVRPASF